MATAYTVTLPNPPDVPADVVVRVVAMRADTKALSREELEALARAYPPPTEASREAIERAIARAPSRPTKPAPKARVKPPSRAKSTPRRKAAKRTTRVRAK